MATNGSVNLATREGKRRGGDSGSPTHICGAVICIRSLETKSNKFSIGSLCPLAAKFLVDNLKPRINGAKIRKYTAQINRHDASGIGIAKTS